MEDYFALDDKDFKKPAKGTRKVDENLYDPSPDQGKNGVYKSVIRLVPYMKDKSKSKYQKFYASLKNPLTGDKMWIDCPSTVSQPSILWDLQTLIKNLKTDEPSIHEELTKLFSRNSKIYSPVYIKADSNKPDLVGKVKILPYSVQIDKLVQAELDPDPEFNLPSVNPFHPLEGKDLMFVVGRKTKEFRDFSSSKFYDRVTPLVITANDKEYVMSENPKAGKWIAEWLLENTPDMSQYYYTPWKEEDYEKVAKLILQIVHYPTLLEKLLASSKDKRMVELITSLNAAKAAKTGSTTSKGKTLELDDEEFNPGATKAKSTMKEPDPFEEDAPLTKAKTSSKKKKDEDEDLDDPFDMV